MVPKPNSKMKNVIVYGLAIPVLLFSFQNCSEVDFKPTEDPSQSLDAPDSEVVDTPDVPVDPVESEPTVEEVVENCQKASELGRLRRLANQPVMIEEQSLNCPFGQDDNLVARNNWIQARRESVYTVEDLPADAVICDMRMNFPQNEKYTYDDQFFFTMNGVVLASNAWWAVEGDSRYPDTHKGMTALSPLSLPESVSGMPQMVNLYSYSWESLVGLQWGSYYNNNDRYDYCLGGGEGVSSCSFPLTQQTGSIVLDIDPLIIKRIALDRDSEAPKFGFVVTGDNDTGPDCKHSKIQFEVSVDYYFPGEVVVQDANL